MGQALSKSNSHLFGGGEQLEHSLNKFTFESFETTLTKYPRVLGIEKYMFKLY
jgi:hypothetical protein